MAVLWSFLCSHCVSLFQPLFSHQHTTLHLVILSPQGFSWWHFLTFPSFLRTWASAFLEQLPILLVWGHVENIGADLAHRQGPAICEGLGVFPWWSIYKSPQAPWGGAFEDLLEVHCPWSVCVDCFHLNTAVSSFRAEQKLALYICGSVWLPSWDQKNFFWWHNQVIVLILGSLSSINQIQSFSFFFFFYSPTFQFAFLLKSQEKLEKQNRTKIPMLGHSKRGGLDWSRVWPALGDWP